MQKVENKRLKYIHLKTLLHFEPLPEDIKGEYLKKRWAFADYHTKDLHLYIRAKYSNYRHIAARTPHCYKDQMREFVMLELLRHMNKCGFLPTGAKIPEKYLKMREGYGKD